RRFLGWACHCLSCGLAGCSVSLTDTAANAQRVVSRRCISGRYLQGVEAAARAKRSESKTPPNHGDNPRRASSRNCARLTEDNPAGKTPNRGAAAAFGKSVALQRAARSG